MSLSSRSINGDSFLGEQQGVVIIPPLNIVTVVEHSHILPYVMLWEPIPKFIGRLSNKCMIESCSGTLKVKCWRTSQSPSLQPRLLHCIDYKVLLVSPIYICECSHTVSATDPQLTENILQEQIPFVLLHRTGFTQHFIYTTVHLFRQGMLLYNIEKFVNKMRQQMVATLIM